MKSTVHIGTSGFRMNKVEYAELLDCVEVQDTFYQPPQIKTLERWREQMPSDFEFAIKAWQLITHEAKSPTYRRLKRKLSESEREDAGYFKPTAIVQEAWDITLGCANALKAETILFQCPASFRQTEENIANLEKFISGLDRGKLNLCWEPRGDWDSEVVHDICDSLDLWHVVDPFVSTSATPERCYLRLHGRDGWRYKYEEEELEELSTMLPKKGTSYVFFNNIHMMEDAMAFHRIVELKR